MDIQDIFVKIIANGYYKEHNVGSTARKHMCLAAGLALKNCVITYEEYHAIRKELNDYLLGYYDLKEALEEWGKPSAFKDRLAIYLDWHNKPKPKH